MKNIAEQILEYLEDDVLEELLKDSRQAVLRFTQMGNAEMLALSQQVVKLVSKELAQR